MIESLLDGQLRPVDAAPADELLGRSLLDVFADTVERFRGRIAIDAADARLTYEELWEAAHEVASRLRALGVGPGDRVGIYVPSGTAQLYVAILGALRAGAAYVPVDADDPHGRATTIWQSAGVCAVVQAGRQIISLAEPIGVDRPPTVDDDAWVIFTSGTTGQPKGVAVSHRSAVAFIDAEALLWTVSAEDRVLAGLSVGFDASCEEIWLAWRHGAALVPAPRAVVRAGVELGPWVAERGVTVISTVPTLAAMWSDADLVGIRLLILGGEACPEALAWRLAETREVWNTYGPTETTVVATAARLHAGAPVTIGWPLRGWEIAVLDELGAPVPVGEPGELVIGGVGVARYIDPLLDLERYAELAALGWKRSYRTGDVVRETIDGLQFLGRRDAQVKLGGRRIELGEIEGQLSSVPGVKAAAAAVQKTEAGNPVLVGYIVGEIDPADVRRALREQLPEGLVPRVVALDALPMSAAGKVNRKALPWPPPRTTPTNGGESASLGATAAWLAERWADQLGPLPMTAESDFFELGGSSLAAAKLVSVIRKRYPSAAVADVYAHRRLGDFAGRLDRLDVTAQATAFTNPDGGRRWGLVQLAGVFALLVLSAPGWLLGVLTINRFSGIQIGPVVGWGWLAGGWVIFVSAPGRASIVLLARRLLLAALKPGRYPRHGWLTCRLWFLERLGEAFRSESLAGTPFAARYARLCGHDIGAGARLGTLPPVTSLVTVGEGATLEPDVDLHGWWLEGDELVVGRLRIGAGARVGSRTLLAPGTEIGAGAEVEPGSMVAGDIPAGERWSGSPAVRIGDAGEDWPWIAPRSVRHRRFWQAMFVVGLATQAVLPLAAAVPGLLLLFLSGAGRTATGTMVELLTMAPLLAGCFLLSYALLVALLVRLVGSLVRPGWHPDEGLTGWALWFSEALMAGARGVLRPLYLSVYTRPWLRLAGMKIGRRAEVSTVVGLNPLTSFADGSFATDDVVLASARARGGWLHVAPIEVGRGTFLGNSAILQGDTKLGPGGLIGVLTVAPRDTAEGTTWFGSPALEFPRVPDQSDPTRTTHPSRRLIVARAGIELIRILLPATVSVALAAVVFSALEAIGGAYGIPAMALATPVLLLGAGMCAAAFTVAAKWLIIGRYRAGQHTFWSFFVWRDEIINSLQEELARAWLLGASVGTPVMSVYLRAMGTTVGRDVWFETLNITEFDLVELGDGCVVNRAACIETHLFHDRLMRIGPASLGPGSSLGPYSVVLPETVLGSGVRVGGRSVVLRGEELPPGTNWQGAPVVGV